MNLIRVAFLVPALFVVVDQQAGRVFADKKEPTKARTNYTIGKETTFITGPLDKDGYIDYAAALNKELGKGITPKSNANVLLWKALGPRLDGRPMPTEFFKLLGIEVPSERDNYFVGFRLYLRDHLKLESGEEIGTFEDQHDAAAWRPWTAKQYPTVASWLKVNEQPLALVVEATRRRDYFNPLTPVITEKGSNGLPGAAKAAVHKCRELANALAARAMLHVAEGRPDEAWQDLLACQRLGRLVGRGATVIEGLAGIAIEGTARYANEAFLNHGRFNAKQAQRYLRDLQQLPPPAAMADKITLGERFIFLDVIQRIHQYGFDYMLDRDFAAPARDADPKQLQAIRNINWDASSHDANRWYDRMSAILRVSDRLDRRKQLDALDTELMALKEKAVGLGGLAHLLLGTENSDRVRSKSIGDILISMMLGQLTKVYLAEDHSEQQQRNVTLGFALAVYQRQNGLYPKQLGELTPKYLPQVPNDLFSGKALIYRPDEMGYLLYSVGPNGKDDGGRWYDDDPPGDDPRIRIPLPELKRKQ